MYSFLRWVALTLIVLTIPIFILYIFWGITNHKDIQKLILPIAIFAYVLYRWYYLIQAKSVVIIDNSKCIVSGIFYKAQTIDIQDFKEVKKEGLRPIYYRIYFTDGRSFVFVPAQKYLTEQSLSVFFFFGGGEIYDVSGAINEVINNMKNNEEGTEEK